MGRKKKEKRDIRKYSFDLESINGKINIKFSDLPVHVGLSDIKLISDFCKDLFDKYIDEKKNKDES